MTTPTIESIPYQTDTALYFKAIRELPYPVWLDSGRPQSNFGRFDIVCADPDTLLSTVETTTVISHRSGITDADHRNPFDLVDSYLQPYRLNWSGDLPFCGGALGYFAYTLGKWLEDLPRAAKHDINLPDMHVGLYSWALIQDHDRKQSWLIFHPQCQPDQRDLVRDIVHSASAESASDEVDHDSFTIKELKHQINVNTYLDAIGKIQRYIRAGDCYQVNYGQRFASRYDGDPFAAYLRLRQALPSPYSAFIQLPQGAILSHSPEQFLTVRAGAVETKPIKGTRPRFSDPTLDRQSAEALACSAKDRAENLMIVDLLRNDLSKSCELHSVNVPDLCELQSYPNVHHLVSTVRGYLRNDRSAINLLKGCFPGGSITGAPKVRAMEIIDELEPSQRSIYCGSIGYLSAHGDMDTSITIRTLACDADTIYCWGGGGIVADSRGEEEYSESLTKVQVLLDNL